MSAVDDLYAYLAAQGLAGGASGWGLVRRRVHDGQDRLVALTEDGGRPPEISEAAGIGDAAVHEPGVQVLVRAEAWNGDAGHAKAAAVLSALHGQRDITLGATTYLRVSAQTPEPVFIGFDDTGRPRHTVSLRLLRNA